MSEYSLSSALAPDLAALHGNWSAPAVSAFLRKTALPAFIRRHGLEGAPRALKRVQRRKSSAVFRCTIGAETYAVKIFGPDRFKPYKAVAEFDVLSQAYYRDLCRRTLAVPRPVSILPDLATIVTEWVDAPTLEHIVQNAPDAERMDAIGAVARWLASHHGSFEPQTRPFRKPSVLKHVKAAMARHGVHPPETDMRFDEAWRRLRHIADSLAGTVVPWVVLHQDANCRNFSYDGSCAFGFDFRCDVRGDPLKDFARLVIEADLLLPPNARSPSEWIIDRSILNEVLQIAKVRDAVCPMRRIKMQLLAAGLLKYFVLIQLPPSEQKDARLEHLLSVLGAISTRQLTDAPWQAPVDARSALPVAARASPVACGRSPEVGAAAAPT